MPKFSVKKPLTIFVAVVAVLVLGVVSFIKMTPDLLPNMDFPYVVIMTAYPGASPERVEAEITKPMEQSMATLEHIKEITSVSAENYSMVMLEFEESVNLDTIGVDIQQNISVLESSWEDTVGTPYLLKVNPSVLPVEAAAVSYDGKDTAQLTDFLNKTLMTRLEGVPGVARISTTGEVERQLHVVMDQDMIDDANQRIRDAINGQLDEAAQELNDKRQELEDAKEELDKAQAQISAGRNLLVSQTEKAEEELDQKQTELTRTKTELQTQRAGLESTRSQVETMLTALRALRSAIAELDGQESAMQSEIDLLKNIQDNYMVLAARKISYESKESLTPEEEADYQSVCAQLDTMDAQLASRSLTLLELPARIAALEETQRQTDEQMKNLEEALANYGITREALDGKITEQEENLVQIEQGIAAIDDALVQLDSGMIQLEDAQKLLTQQKNAGMSSLNSAASELASNGTALSDALTQVDGGLETLETSREEALKQADLREILTMEMLGGVLQAQNFSMPAGYVRQDDVSYMVSVGDEITTQEELENLLLLDLHMDGVEPIRLKDIAVVMLTDNSGESYARLNGEEGIVLTFEKQSTYATADVTDNLGDRFQELEAEFPGLHFVALMSQGDYIYMIVDSIMNSLLLGAVFATLILLLFLRDLRPTLITVCAIPISVIFAVVLMYFSGVTINMISLSGLAVSVGMLVDNSVVVIENIYRLRSRGATVYQAAVHGAKQVSGAVTASTLTTVCVFLPIVFVEGITRQLFTDLALTMTYSLLASLIVALTLVPAMASKMLKKEKAQKQSKVGENVMPGYEKTVTWVLNHKAVVLIAAVLLLGVTAVLSVSRGFIFMPEMDMSSVNVTITMPEDSTMEQTTAMADQVLERVATLDGIETVGAMSGGSGLMGGGSGSVTVYITLSDENASGKAIGKQIEELCADLPCTVSASSAMMDMSALSGSGISLELYGNDMEALQHSAVTAAEALRGIEGVGQVSDGLEESAEALHIRVDRNEAMSRGMTVAQIYMEIASALTEETTAATLDLGTDSVSVILEKPQFSKVTADGLEDYVFEVTGQDGEMTTFTLGDVAEVETTVSLSTINRANQRRYLTVTAEVLPGYNVTKLTTQAQRVLGETSLDEGVTYGFTGENETIMEAVQQLLLMLLLGIILVYLVMVAQFQSLKSPMIVMFTIPLAFTGGFLGLMICGMEVSVVSLIGFVMLTGIIVNNGIVLVDYINQLRQGGMARREAILEAGKTRIRPILMTSLTTILGLLDMAIRRSAGTALMKPMAVVCIGGLIYATVMTLLVVPCIYEIVNRKDTVSIRDEDLELKD